MPGGLAAPAIPALGVQGHLWLHSKLEVSLGHEAPSQKQTNPCQTLETGALSLVVRKGCENGEAGLQDLAYAHLVTLLLTKAALIPV